MKKLFYVLITVLTLCALVSCGGKDSGSAPTDNSAESVSNSAQSSDGIDVDLTKLSSTMVYSEVYNMMYTPGNYIGKTVKMSGKFSYYEDPDSKAQYFACIIADATACCSQGLEFVLNGEHTYPDDYPDLDSEITVTGSFDVYEENGNQYCRLINASLVK